MLPAASVAIRVVDAAYDLDSHPKPWLSGLLKSGQEALDQGLGCVAVALAGRTVSGEPLVSRVVTHGDASDDLAIRLALASRTAHVDTFLPGCGTSASVVRTLSAVSVEAPDLHYAVQRRVGCKDLLCVLALDSEVHGVLLLTPTRKRISLSAKAEQRWRTLASHIGAADRLRRALGRSNRERLIPVTALPRELRARTFSENPTKRPPGPSLQEAAVHIDSAKRERSGSQDPGALDVLRGLVSGELSMVGWFDRDGRRFILSRRNDPSLGDLRVLTPREREVVLRTAHGESRKLAAYNMGICRTRVSRLLGLAMRKMGVKTQTELIMQVRCLERHGILHDQ